ncbi:hypothetical protein F5B22DRAFT_606337 [Xylaria bambusicola]|uniref:uncharacterized protein n=1 Tax=Xylaria bambusicola TaxID=326684 RepID=UPI002008152B|nr:uncharacterized protein F5B22DRAFT_606337 [Xylaria bambusicola]KAI0516737.1 hypothetical protein F5B22DRAFT_606337 [Xylaria bambusicola]
MATTDPLDSVIVNAPDWVKRLEELSGQIEQRQRDLAKFSGAEAPSSSARSIRNRGSTESLKPKDDGPSLPTPDPDPTTDQMPKPIITALPPQTPSGNARPNGPQPPSTPASDPWTGSSLVRHTNELVATAQRRARATVRKRQKTDSMMSGEAATPKYRSRRMVMVYYDSYVQSFFEELVKFVSAQRNLMRKAKMAAKVAHIRRLAELEMPEEDEDDEGGELKPGNGLIAARPTPPAPNPRPGGPEEMKLQYFSTRSYGGALRSPGLGLIPGRGMRTSALNGGLGAFNEKGDIWDELDKGLEFVQGLCERGAHQFLRDGDCNEEIEKIKTRLVKVKELAVNEKERVVAEKTKDEEKTEPKNETKNEPKIEARPEIRSQGIIEPDPNPIPESTPEIIEHHVELVPDVSREAAPEMDAARPRVFRPSTMRRDIGASNPSKFPAREGLLEIDEGIDVDMDDFKPVYRSTRLMRRPV